MLVQTNMLDSEANLAELECCELREFAGKHTVPVDCSIRNGMRLAFSNSILKIGGWKGPSKDGTGLQDLPHDPAQHPELTLRTIEPIYAAPPSPPTPIDRRPTLRLRTPGSSEAQPVPIASSPSLFVKPGIDLRHQDRSKGKFPDLRFSCQSAQVAAS